MLRLPDDGTIVSRQLLTVPPAYREQVRIERIRYRVDGLQVVGFIATPTSTEPRQFPVLIYNRGGFRSFSKIKEETLARLASYAARGYVVLASQYRGNDGGEGQDEYGGADLKDLFALAWLAESLPQADASRMVMFGHSRGGMMTYLCIRHGLPLRAAATTSAPSDLFRRPLPPAIAHLYHDLFGDPEQNPTDYRERSALCWPEQLRVPLLLQVGALDRRVDPAESELLAAALQERGYTHKFICYPEADHHLMEVAPDRDREIFDWFDRFL
ncbi:alpha/beta hydrolase family protein [Tumebacillus permanentifrigoris]|uniref:Prolyl oligopeptidase family protein n=1 Tax=Tumebacillus permanentifrigoris TaxID=378543 RepID=A0A316E0Z8_9BACL|nr:prolyl oligopeptidase family serine peptidase [Tumebacillus permanentifrigoris]PWK16490.1 prolyl oligopeptidase family protein [Tumebacillus permanentifrigoris]